MSILRIVEISLWVVLAALAVVMPNAFKEVSAAVLVLISLSYLLFVRLRLNLNFILLWILSCVVTFGYLWVGHLQGAPDDAFYQIPIVYVLTPLLWAISLQGLLVRYGLKNIVHALIFCIIAGIVSQVYYFWAFSALGPDAVSIMAANPNVDLTARSAAAVMYVFGSMIFLYAGLIAAPDVIQNKTLRYLVILCALGSAFTSGRSALVLALFVGAAVSLFAGKVLSSKKNIGSVFSIAPLGIALALCAAILARLYEIDISVSVNSLIEKVVTGGGAGRVGYAPLLLSEARNDYFLGAGHGIGVQIIANERFPWRYEIVGLATLYRVGLIGSIIYSLPFLWAISKSIRLWSVGGLNAQERFLCAAMISAFIAANTNPYIEAFAFQWMYVLPCLYFIALRRQPQRRSRYPNFTLRQSPTPSASRTT